MELNRLPMTPLQRSLSDAYGQMQATPFERGFTSSDLATQAASLETSAMEAATAGDLAARDALLGQAKGLRQRAVGWAPRVDSMADIENPIDALSFAAQGMGSATRSTAPSIIGGLAGAATGVGLPAALAARGIIGGGAAALNAARAMPTTLSAVQRFAPMVGAMVPGYQAEMEEAVGGAVNDQQIMDTRTPEEILAAGRAKGLINMIPEAIGPAMMVSKVAGTGLRKAVTSPKQGVGTTLKGVATGFGTEAATEGVQSLVGQATQAGLRNEQLKPDWQQVADEAVIGGLFGGGMGVVGGVADAAYGATRGTVDGAGDAASAIGKGAQNILGRIGGAAEQNPTIQRGMDTAKQYGQAAVDAAGRFVDGARGTFQEGMDDLRQHVDDSMQAYKAGAGSEIAATDAANAIRKGVGTIVDSIVSGVAEVTGKKKEEAQVDVDNLTANPFAGGHADSGLNDPQAVAQHYSEYVQKNGNTAAIVAQRILDNTSMAAHVPVKAREMLKQALAKDESGVPFIKNGTVAAERMQGQIGMLVQALKSRESLKRSVDDLYNSFVEAQGVTNTTVPGKFSRQATMQPDAVANVRQYLEDLGLDKQVVNKLSTLAGKGNKSMFDMAVDRDLLGQNLLGDIHDKESAKFASEQAKMIKALVSEQAVADTPKPTRSERRKAKQEAHAIKSVNEVDRNLSALPHLIDEVVGQHLEEAAKNAEGFSGDALNTPDVRNMMTNALTQLVIGIIDDKVTPQQIAKMISAANEHMGEAGAAMLDRIASIAEWHANRVENPKIAQRAAALRDSLDGNGVGAPIHALSKVLFDKPIWEMRDFKTPSKQRLTLLHKIMGQLIGAYIDTYQGDGPTYELRNDLTAAKARKKQAEKQGDEVAAAKYDKQIFDLENQLDGVDLHEHFRNEVKRITGKDVAKKVIPIIKKRLQEIHTNLDQPITMRRKGDTDRAGQYVPSKMKSSSNPNFGEADENDNEARQAISENAAVGDEEAAEMADGVANEGGTQGEVDNNFQHFGGAHGEPVRGKELGQLIRDVVDKHGLARTEVMSVRDWALEEAERTNRSLKSLLSEAAAKLYKADQARLERLKAEHEHLMALATDKYARSGKKRALTGGRLEGSGREESEAEVAKRKGVEAAINSTEERIANYETVKGNGEEFFSADSYNANAFKFVTISPAHGAVGTGEVNEKTLDKYTLTSVPKSNDGFTAPGVVKRSVMYLKNENGSTRMLDFSLMLYHQISGSERAERDADVTGAGEKNIESSLVNKVRVAFAQTIASMMMSDALSKDDTFFSVYGEQAYRSDNEFEFNPNMVIYRDPVNHNFLTYGQVFGRKGEDAISSTKVTPTNHKFSDAALESILPSEGADVWSLDKRSKEHVVPKDWVSTNKVMANGDQRAHFSPRALLKEMMNRYGMRADEILTDSSDGISKTLAAKLIVEGLSVLKAHGWELTTDIGSSTVSSLLLWRTDYGRTVDETTLGDLKNDILTRLAKGTDADTYGNGKALSTDYRSDKVGRMTERLVEATKELSAAREELARSAGKSSSVIADKKRKVSVKESAVSVLQNNLAIEQKLIYERKAGASEIERLDRRDQEMPDQGGVVDIADGVNAERRRDATLFDRSAAMSGDFSGQGHLAPKLVHDATSDSGVRAVNGPATQGMESADGSRRVVDHRQNTDQRAAFKKAKKIENTAGFENAPPHDTRPVGAGTKVEGGRPEGPSIRDKGEVKKDDKPSFTMRSEDVVTTDSNALRRAKAAEAKQALDNEGRRLEGSTKEGVRYSTNAVREGAERARERAAESVAAKTAAPKVEAAKIEESKPETPRLGEMMQALVNETLRLSNEEQKARIMRVYAAQGPKTGKALRDAVAAANPSIMDGSSVVFHANGKFSHEAAGNAPGVDGRAEDDHKRRLGDAVDLLFDKTLPRGVSGKHESAKDRTDVKNATKALNRVNPGAFSIRGSTAHENWHAVKEMLLAIGPEGQAIVDTIERAAHRPESLGWIAQQLAARGTDNEAALKQLADPEEASAFLFQFFVENEGKMPVPLGARGVLSRVTKFLKNLVGIRDDIIKAGDFFNYFNSGEFLKNHANPQAVLEGMLKNKAEKAAYHLNKAFAPIRELASAAFGHAIDRIREMKIPEYNDAIDRYTKGWDGYAGYAEEQRARFMEYSNEYAEIVEGHDIDHLPEAQQKQLEKLIQRFEKYRKDAGFGSGFNTDRKKIPPSLDTEKISANLNGFKHDLLTYGGVKINEGDAEAIVNQIIVDGYWRDRHSLTGSSKADLFFDHPEIMNKWKSADKNQHAFTYFKEGTRAAELARINNPPAESNLPPLSALLEAGDAKATPHQRKMMKALMATYEGRSSYEMNPTLRKLFGASISFMNMSLLPFAVFSQMLEPLQLAFRKNSLDGTLRTAWRGLTDLPRTFEAVDSRTAKDKWEKISGKLGLIPVHAAVGMMAELMSDIPLTGKLQKANQIFFRYNGMEQWTRSMHIAATQNAFEFIKHHDKHPTELGRRLLGELGLKPGQVRYAADGEIDFDEPAMRRAILQYVNESMAHPDPGTNTMWMNDPHFALLAHLKRFTFGFSYYIHGRALNEIKNDNWKALLPLAYAIPWMIAVDGVKDFIKPGDEVYKNNWDVSDYVIHGADRAGLYGRYGIGADIGKNIGFGGGGVESLAPTAEAVSKVMRGVADGNTLDAVGSILPGHQFVQ